MGQQRRKNYYLEDKNKNTTSKVLITGTEKKT
jgi:hypothetical protein